MRQIGGRKVVGLTRGGLAGGETAVTTNREKSAETIVAVTREGSNNRNSEETEDAERLLEAILDRRNLNKAYKRVKSNKGAAGIDGMIVEDALPWLTEHRDELLDSIRNGKYKPSPVRRKEIPKGDGGVRKLGIPTVIDRIIQQATFNE